jgi:imidazolonepropionase-like amidohydrolase
VTPPRTSPRGYTDTGSIEAGKSADLVVVVVDRDL